MFAVKALIGVALLWAFYFVYIHLISLLDPLLSIVVGGAFFLLIVLVLINFFVNIKDFVVSIFKKDRGVDEKGFKRF